MDTRRVDPIRRVSPTRRDRSRSRDEGPTPPSQPPPEFMQGDGPREHVLVTDLLLMTDSPRWGSNARVLAQDGVFVIDRVDIFNLKGTLEGKAMNRLTTDGHLCPPSAFVTPILMGDVRLAVVSGLHPHHLVSAAVDALLHQLPQVDAILVLYAHGDVAPRCQERHVLHLQGWYADVDAPTPYILRSVSGYSRCHSAESRARGVLEDPALVRVSMFVKGEDIHWAMVGTQISPRRAVQDLRHRGKDVLFLAEGDASLARACLEQAPLAVLSPLAPMPSLSPLASMHHLRYHRDGWVATYSEVLERELLGRHDNDGSQEAMSTTHAAQKAAETWARMIPYLRR